MISEIEERTIFELLLERFPDYSESQFDLTLTDFFESSLQLEEYLHSISDSDLKMFVLKLSERAAAADGLDPRENIALAKAYAYWEFDRDA